MARTSLRRQCSARPSAFTCDPYQVRLKEPQCQSEETALLACERPDAMACFAVCEGAGCPENEFCVQLCLSMAPACEESPTQYVGCLWQGSEGCDAQGYSLQLSRELLEECATLFPEEAECRPFYFP